MRRVLAIAFALLGSAGAAAESGLAVRLDRAGLEALARERPEHHARIQELLRARDAVGDEALPGCAGVSHDVRSLDVSLLLLTTYPPQRELSFMIDDVIYRMRVEARTTSRILPAEGELPSATPCPPRSTER